jgi:uncharacterized membrane protein (Fun14 family)
MIVVSVAALGLALVAIGYFPARLVTGSRVWCLLVAPVTTALLAGSLGTIGVLLRLPAGFTIIGTLALSATAGAVVIRRAARERAARESESYLPLLLPIAGLLPFLTVRRAPYEWDARSIWWFHARWFADGGAAVWDAMRNPAFAFSHPDYPPLAPATNGALWWISGSTSLKQAQIVTAIVTLSAVAVLGFAVWYAVRRALPGWVAVVVAGVLVLATYGVASIDSLTLAPGTNGYVDVLWSAAFAAGCVFVLATDRDPVALRWGALCLAVAALTKNEGLVAVVLVVVLALVRHRFTRRAVIWLGCSLVPGLAWLVVARVAGAESEYLGSSKTTQLLRLDPDVLRRISPAADGVWQQMSSIVIVVAGVSVLGLLIATRARRELSGTSWPWMWIAWLATTTSVVYAYVVSPAPLHWHLRTSVDRTTMAPRLILLTEALVWGAAAVAALRSPSRPAADGERPTRAEETERESLAELPVG